MADVKPSNQFSDGILQTASGQSRAGRSGFGGRRPPEALRRQRLRISLREVGAIAKAWRLGDPSNERRKIIGHLALAARLTKGEAPEFVWRPAEFLTQPVVAD